MATSSTYLYFTYILHQIAEKRFQPKNLTPSDIVNLATSLKRLKLDNVGKGNFLHAIAKFDRMLDMKAPASILFENPEHETYIHKIVSSTTTKTSAHALRIIDMKCIKKVRYNRLDRK